MLGGARKIRAGLKRLAFIVFDFGQIFNVFILPKHYYAPISATRTLRANTASWNHPIDIRFLPLSDATQRNVLTTWIAPFAPEYRGNRIYRDAVQKLAGPGYGPIEAQCLHGFIRKVRPKRIIEVGSGVSTMCMLAAVELNVRDGGPPCQLTCIEPNPSPLLRSAQVTLLDRPVEDVDLSLFDQLEAGDLLFIDSTHAFRPAGDVSRIYLEILPRLKSGIYIHIHDIYIPYAFQRDVHRTFMQSMETALLIAMLAHSTRYDILLCMSYLHYYAPDLLKQCFSEYVPQSNDGGLETSNGQYHFPSSTYLLVN